MRPLLVIALFLTLNTLSLADENKDRMLEGSCGDHWFKVSFTANERTKEVNLEYSGDSGEEGTFKGTLIKTEEDTSFRINFNDGTNGYLFIDGTDHYHNIFWGTLSRSGRPEDAVGLGLCSIF